MLTSSLPSSDTLVPLPLRFHHRSCSAIQIFNTTIPLILSRKAFIFGLHRSGNCDGRNIAAGINLALLGWFPLHHAVAAAVAAAVVIFLRISAAELDELLRGFDLRLGKRNRLLGVLDLVCRERCGHGLRNREKRTMMNRNCYI